MHRFIITAALALTLAAHLTAQSAWPTYRADNTRSGTTNTELPDSLSSAWKKQNPRPEQAWTGPAKWDAYNNNKGLQSLRNFDPTYFTTGNEKHIYYGSSADNALHCLDANTGKELWVFFTEAPVRFPPTLHKNLALVGSDDGHAYAIDTTTGKQSWKFHAAPEPRRIPSNGKWISPWPIRTSILVQQGKAYFAASLVPWEKSYLHCVDAGTGKKIFTAEQNDVTLQGAFLSNNDRLYAPQGRSAPLVYDLKNGKQTATVAQAGGTFALLDSEGNLYAGPNNQHSKNEEVRGFNPDNKTRIATFNDTNRLVISKNIAYLHGDSQLKAFDLTKSKDIQTKMAPIQTKLNQLNKTLKTKPANAEDLVKEKANLQQQLKQLAEQQKSCWLWQRQEEIPLDLVATPNKIIAGFNNRVAMINKSTGEEIWSAHTDGKVHGISIINKQLIISTDKGTIQAFK